MGKRRPVTIIIETAVYDGAVKVWRVLNLNTGTVYSVHYDTEVEALASIEHGTSRAGNWVKRVTLRELKGSAENLT